MKALFVDFEDSFSYNIIQELLDIGMNVRLIHWSSFQGDEDEDLLVFGPGPGHPDEYKEIFQKLNSWLEKKKKFLGICLGHQIFWRLNGAEVLKSSYPIHGQRVKLSLDDHWKKFFQVSDEPWVQRYNSLSVLEKFSALRIDVENFVQQGEIYISKGENIITYQFHPESVGTNSPKVFFRPLLGSIP